MGHRKHRRRGTPRSHTLVALRSSIHVAMHPRAFVFAALVLLSSALALAVPQFPPQLHTISYSVSGWRWLGES